MRLYKVSFTYTGNDDAGAHAGYGFYASKKAASAAIRESANTVAEIEAINIKPTKAGIIAALNCHARHADNG